MTAFYFSHSHTFMKHMYQHISTHKTHMYAMLTSCLLCICNFFHLFFLPPSCFSLSLSLSVLRLDAGKLWIVFYFCAATSLTLFFLLCHSTRHVLSHGSFTPTDTGPESAASLSPHISISLFLPLISAQGLFWGRNWKLSLVLMFISPFQALHCISIWECIRAPDFR